MLTFMRNSAQSILIKGLLGIIVITFVISFGVGTFTNQKEVLVEVGREEIMVNQFQKRYQQEMDRLRNEYGENADVFAQRFNLKEQVMNDMVNRSLLLQAAEEAGLVVTEEEVRQTVTSQEMFHVDKRFDISTYHAILSQNRITPADYEALIRQDLLLARQRRNILAGIVVTPGEVEQRYKVENEKAEVVVMTVDPDKFRLDQAPDEAALKAYYDKNQVQFTQDKQFKIRYFLLSLADVEQDASISERAVTRYYERNREHDYTKARKVRASHILKKVASDAPAEEVEKARKAMEAVLKEVESGKNFGELAKVHSEDLTKMKGGDLGFFAFEEMLLPVAQAAFKLQKGGTSGLVKSQLGFHIVKLTDDQPAVVTPLEAVKGEIEKKLIAQRAENRLELELKRLPGKLATEGMEKIAGGLGKTPVETPLFDSRAILDKIGSALPLYGQLGMKRQGQAGVWRRNPVQGHLFYEVVEVKEQSVKPMEEVKKELASAVELEARKEKALAEAKEVFPQLKSVADFQAYARKKGFNQKTVSFTAVDNSVEGFGFNKELQHTGFGLSAEKPVGLSIKDNQALLVLFKRRFMAEPEKAAEKLEVVKTQLEVSLREYVMQKEISRLKEELKVKVVTPELVATNSFPAN